MEALASFFARISGYNLLNYFIPGAALYVLLKYIVGLTIFDDMEWYNLMLVMYFIGMVSNRLSSLIVEKYATKWKFVTYAPYGDFVKAEQKDGKLTTLSETNNMYRTFIAAVLVAMIIMLVKNIFDCPNFCDIIPCLTLVKV